MGLDIVSVVYTGMFLGAVGWLYGWLVGVLCSPFLLSERVRSLFAAVPPRGWVANYALWIPLPAAVFGFWWGFGMSFSRDVLDPGTAAPLYAAGMDGLVLATLISAVLWPAMLLYVLPRRGYDWRPEDDEARSLLVVLGGLAWYLVFLVGPVYVLTIFAGFGQVMSHSG